MSKGSTWATIPRQGLAFAERHPTAVAFGLGALLTLALPPLHLWPALLGFAILLHLLCRCTSRRAGFLLGWSFGFGHFLFGLYWIAIAFFTDAERFGLLAVPAVVLLAAYLAVYPALALGLVGLRRWRRVEAQALALAVAWTMTEMLRGVALYGFPWNLIGYTWSGSLAISQLASVTGIFGLSFLAVALGALPAVLLQDHERGRWWAVIAAALVLVVIWSGGRARLADAPAAAGPDVRLRLVQANIAQHHKWQPELRARWFQRHLELSAPPADGVSHVVWPESATPYALESDDVARRLVAEVTPDGGYVITGGDRFDLDEKPPQAWNSLFVLDGAGDIRALYDKRLLVPFGEFLPLRDLLGRIGLGKLTQGSIDFVAGPGLRTVRLPGLPPFSPLICYEAIFSGRVATLDDRPAWLLNLTNDAWFGRSAGPYQHFAMARMRAVEEGLPLVRSANTGISAVVDPYGRIRAELGLGATGVLDVVLPTPLPAPTPFARVGVWVVWALLGAATLGIALIEWCHAKRTVNKS